MAGYGDQDDLPKTLRRQRDEKERLERERMDQTRSPSTGQPRIGAFEPASLGGSRRGDDFGGTFSDEPQAAVVTRLQIPFFRLMAFFIKAVFAAIPALILLGAILWGIGQLLKTYFPWLVQMQIVISFPKI
jgi:hypothetical protein